MIFLRNAIDLLFEIDFVLPFSKWMQPSLRINRKNSMWFMFLNGIIPGKYGFEFKASNKYKDVSWFQSRDSDDKEYELLSSMDVANKTTKNDWNVIKKHNIYDSRLFMISQQIEKIDLMFWEKILEV